MKKFGVAHFILFKFIFKILQNNMKAYSNGKPIAWAIYVININKKNKRKLLKNDRKNI